MVIELITAGACVLAALGELLHARRCRRLRRLAFGPRERAAHWVKAVGPLRVAAFGALAWGLTTLVYELPKVHKADELGDDDYRHLLLVLDVSPSMRLKDAGPTHEQTRRERARDLIESLFSRVSIGRYRVTVVAVYNGAKPVVVDTQDAEVVRNILADLPMHFAFKAGPTRLFDGLAEAARIARPWPPRSTVLVLVSDGDTVPATGMPQLPASIMGTLVVGVGDPLAGSFIDGRQSRQDVSTLRQIAARLGGAFHNGNEKHLPTDTIRAITEGAGRSKLEQLTRREYALLCVALGAAVLALMPLLLHLLGTAWRPGVRRAGADPGKSAAKPDGSLGPAAASAR